MIHLRNIHKKYNPGKAEVHALRGVDLEIKKGEFVAIMGPSGSGKSTLLHILGFLDKADSGSYLFEGSETIMLTEDELAVLRNNFAGFIFQQFHLLPSLTALENAGLPLIYAGKREVYDRSLEKISDVGLKQRAVHRPNEMSGGEQQRVAIARALVNNPQVIFADEPTGNLDTGTRDEIMSILLKLNEEGKTIVMVTHEKEISECAERTIQMRDGKIISDRKTARGKSAVKNQTSESSGTGSLSLSHSSSGITMAATHLKQAVNSIFTHKMRAFLSVLGILIGVSAVIAMLAIGEGAREDISRRLAALGTNILSVRTEARRGEGGVAREAGSDARFTLEDAEALGRLTMISMVSPAVEGRAQAIYLNRNWNTRVQGTGADNTAMRNLEPLAGRYFTNEEVQARERVAVLGLTVVRELFHGANPVGSTIRINRQNFRVIGVLSERGATGRRDLDDVIEIPVTTAMYRLLGQQYVRSIDVKVASSELIDEAKTGITSLLQERHRLAGNPEEHFVVQDYTEVQEALEGTTRTMSVLLASIAAISLVVGGIGIMNIMLVSVTERTREIGLRKAIGAKRKDIMSQFLIESVFMTSSGGIIGIALGAAISAIMAGLTGWTIVIAPYSIVLATAFSVAVGVGFGLWPARQASILNPVEALRYE